MKLTRAAVQNIKLPADKAEAIFFDDEIAGFGLRVRAGGSRTWIVQYKIGAKHRRMTLGSVALLDPGKARDNARDLLAAVRLGQDPANTKVEARARAHETFEAVANRFLARQRERLRPRTYAETERYLLNHWKRIHGLALSNVSRATVAAQLLSIAEQNGPIAADRARAALSTIFAWAIREGLGDVNPVIGTNRAGELRSRDRVLSDAELAAIWKALPDDQYGVILRLLILTGQRREEIGGLRWSEIDLGRKFISLPSERTKNGRPHQIPVTAPIIAVIEAQPRRRARDLIFGEGQGAFQGWSRAKAALDKRVAQITGKSLAPWRLHDVRRTVATGMADLGVQPHVIEAVLNHVSGHKAGVAGVYNRSLYAQEKRAALELWANHILAIIGEARDAGLLDDRFHESCQ